MVAGSRLNVLENIDALISESELVKLQEVLLHYAGKGIAFLYLSSHFKETLRFCHRTALMSNGRILICRPTGQAAETCSPSPVWGTRTAGSGPIWWSRSGDSREKYPPEPTFKERTDEYETI